jgi:hypothetical protein
MEWNKRESSFAPEDERYERKFIIATLTEQQLGICVRLHPAAFIETYPERYINNLYFDSFDLRSYAESVNGVKNRVKFRIRWYGHLFGLINEPVLELKCKNGLVGTKRRFSLAPFCMGKGFCRDKFWQLLKASGVPEIIMGQRLPADFFLLNRYKRKYFQSADKRYRITIDSQMEFHALKPRDNSFLTKTADTHTVILELKYHSMDDAGAEKITNFFSFRVCKSSKYVTGIERVFLPWTTVEDRTISFA